jgi:hypothetical protein
MPSYALPSRQASAKIRTGNPARPRLRDRIAFIASAKETSLMPGIPILLRAAALLLPLTFASSVVAQSVGSVTLVPLSPYPGDHVHVPLHGGGTCNAATLDASRVPQLRPILHDVDPQDPHNDFYRYELRYWLKNADDAICGTPPPPGDFHADVGALPPGFHQFDVIGFLDDAVLEAYTTTAAQVAAHAGLPLDAAGLWVDPQQGGRGLSVLLLSSTAASLIWLTHDAQGTSTWVASNAAIAESSSRAAGTAFTTRGMPLAPGPAVAAFEDWGSLDFSYEGCGRARLTWDAIDPAIVDGAQSLRKLAQSLDDPSCAPRGAVGVLWVRES